MALPVAIVIGGVIKLAAPHVARFLVKHGFKKASQTAVRGKTKIPSVSSRQAKDIVNKEQQTSSELKKQIKELRGKSLRLQKEGKIPKGAERETLKKLAELKDRAHKLGSQEKKLEGMKKDLDRLGSTGKKALKYSPKAKELTGDPTLRKFLESGPREFKRGGRIGKPKGVGKALRGYGKAMKRGN